MGYSVSNAGDVNGDGLIIGAPWADPNGESSGSTYVVFGKGSGFGTTLDLTNLDGSNGFRLDGVAADDYSGRSVSNGGDINGDGFDELIIGANGADPNGESSGSTYVVFGKGTGFDSTLDLTSLDGSNGFSLDGAERDEASGFSVSGAGDVNGDGFDDVIVSGYTGQNGSSYVVFGKSSGFDATLDLSCLDGNHGFRLDCLTDEFGHIFIYGGISVSNAGDVNGDDIDDLIVGVLFGSSFVVFGKAAGFSATLDVSNLDSNSGFRLNSESLTDYAGDSVSGAGDINGDGFDDLIIGAPHADSNELDSGSSYVIFGRSDFGGMNMIEGTPGDDILKGTSAADIFKAGEGNDAMIGRGGADVFHGDVFLGDAGNDHIKVADLSFDFVAGGTGNDVLHLDGSNLNLDLSVLGDKISGIETICLYGRGDNSLTLGAEDLLNLSHTTNTFKVHGNLGDRIVLEDEWVDRGSHGFYHTYVHNTTVLLVGQSVNKMFDAVTINH